MDQLIGCEHRAAFRVMLAMAQGTDLADGPEAHTGCANAPMKLEDDKAAAVERLVASGIDPDPGADGHSWGSPAWPLIRFLASNPVVTPYDSALGPILI